MRRSFLAATVLGGLLTTCVAGYQPPEKKDATAAAPQAPKAPEVVKVEKGKFSIEVTTKGVLEAEEVVELSYHLESWTGMTVLKAVPHGSVVKQGDTLIELDLEKIDKAIKDLEVERDMSELAHQQAYEELKTTERLFPLDMAMAEQSFKNAQEDFKKFKESDLPLLKRNAEFQSKSSKNFLEYAMEELKQLEKMYKADDIKEETEEIILKRQRDTVEAAKNNAMNAEKRSTDMLSYTLPRQEQSMKDAHERATINWEKAKITMPAGLKIKQLAFEKAKYDRTKASERYENLKADRAKMAALKAPVDGIIYYGKSTKGTWNSTAIESKLTPRGFPISNDEVIMTIVKPGKLAVRASVEEKDKPNVKAGQAVKVTPTALPDRKLPGKVESVASVPLGSSFDLRLKLEGPVEDLVPGMTCTVKIKAYHSDDALTLPATAVTVDEADEDQYVVYVASSDGKSSTKTKVKIGKRSGDKVEILEGLKEGTSVLKEKPAKK
jgi:multidrug efflux pump subunit AcrA (membrane-fusion protein)